MTGHGRDAVPDKRTRFLQTEMPALANGKLIDDAQDMGSRNIVQRVFVFLLEPFAEIFARRYNLPRGPIDRAPRARET